MTPTARGQLGSGAHHWFASQPDTGTIRRLPRDVSTWDTAPISGVSPGNRVSTGESHAAGPPTGTWEPDLGSHYWHIDLSDNRQNVRNRQGLENLNCDCTLGPQRPRPLQEHLPAAKAASPGHSCLRTPTGRTPSAHPGKRPSAGETNRGPGVSWSLVFPRGPTLPAPSPPGPRRAAGTEA